jgi:predicted nucleic acid-binding protein
MKIIFADSFYWIALLSPKDTWHSRVIEWSQSYPDVSLVITDGIIDEIFAHFSKQGDILRGKVIELYQNILDEPNIQLIAYNQELRQAGIELYKKRPDKGYSLTDCISMVIMKKLNISEVLTNDKYFSQEGFTILFSKQF